MDKITRSYLTDFFKLHEIKSKGEAFDFEKFSNYSIVHNNYNGSFDVEDIGTGDSTQGIDGIAIIVNGKLILNKEEVDDLVNLNKYIEVLFVFIQSKTSKSFEGTEIGNFLFSVKNFFSEDPIILQSTEIKNQFEITQKIFEFFPKMTKGKPKLKLYFVTTGIWQGEKPLEAIMENGVNELKTLNYFSEVEFFPTAATEIQNLYRKTKDLSKATFTFKDKVTLSDIKGIKEAYYGILPFSEFTNIITNEDNLTIKNIFYDNVRDYLGDNAVNESIDSTLRNHKFDLFTVLNNGVTIVASDLQTAGNKFTITDYQIVNGCQTSHVLFENRGSEGIQNVHIPIRLIVTKDEDVKNEITIATNNQTAIKPEQLEALSQFQKGVEEFYKTFDESHQLFYERRTNQYSSDDAVYKSKIVTIPQQIKTFAAMFLDLPHVVSGYYGTIMNSNGDKIFVKGQSYFPYYLSSYTFYKLDSFFRLNIFDKKYRKVKYHILMLFRSFSNIDALPAFNAKKMDAYCNKIFEALKDDDKAIILFKKCIETIDSSGLDLNDRYLFKQADSTKRLKS